MSKKTSVEWLFDMLWEEPKDKLTWYSILKKAEEMHKQEIVNAFEEGQKQVINLEGNWYYNETYNNEKA